MINCLYFYQAALQQDTSCIHKTSLLVEVQQTVSGFSLRCYCDQHHAAALLEDRVRRFPKAKGLKRRALDQAGRELLLAQSSDWAFMINSGAMADYARQRTENHLLRLFRICSEIDAKKIDEPWLTRVENQDNIFPRMRYESFG